jgi:hypothetical protein
MIAMGKRRIERDPLGSARAQPPGALRYQKRPGIVTLV